MFRGREHQGGAAPVEAAARATAGCVHVIHDDVVQVIARPEMAEGPQHADVFLHVYFDSVEHAQQAAQSLASYQGRDAAFSIYRVRTLTVI